MEMLRTGDTSTSWPRWHVSAFAFAFPLLFALRPFKRNYWMDARIVQPGLPAIATAVFHPTTHRTPSTIRPAKASTTIRHVPSCIWLCHIRVSHVFHDSPFLWPPNWFAIVNEMEMAKVCDFSGTIRSDFKDYQQCWKSANYASLMAFPRRVVRVAGKFSRKIGGAPHS